MKKIGMFHEINTDLIQMYQRSSNEDHPLHDAVNTGNTSLLSQLIDLEKKAKRSIDVPGLYMMTPLHRAARIGHIESVNLLVNAGASVNLSDIDGQTPIFHAIEKNHQEIVMILIAAGADLGIQDNLHHTPLDVARKEGNMNICDLILSSKSPPRYT